MKRQSILILGLCIFSLIMSFKFYTADQRIQDLDNRLDEAYADLDDALWELEQCESKEPKKVILHRGINHKDMYRVIYNTMIYLGEENPRDFTQLLMVTYLAESGGGRHLYQLGNGPAKGVFQVETSTEKEIFRVFLKRNPKWRAKILALKGAEVKGLENSAYNIAYNASIAWALYKWRMPKGTPPDKNDKIKQAQFHKKYYNTSGGKASIEKTLALL